MNFERNPQDNQREIKSRKGQLASRNASTFNPISFNPEANGNIEENERLQKKKQQALYRDQLDNMVAQTRDQRTNERTGVEDYNQMPQREQEQPRYNDQNPDSQRRVEEEAYLQEQYKRMAEYERYQQQMEDLQKNSRKGGNYPQDGNEGYSRQAQEGRQQYEYPTENNKLPQKVQTEESTFQQQDNQREQQSGQVWNSYQRAHDEKERNKLDFDRNLVNIAAQDKQKEEQRAMSEWEKKKRMQQETADANRRAAESRMVDKKRQRIEDSAFENQRAQDSLSQFERDGLRQQEAQRRLKEENIRVLQQQMRDANTRKQNKEDQFGHPVYDSVDHLQQRNYDDRSLGNPLAPSHSKMNQASNQDRVAGRTKETMGNLSSQMDKLSMKGPFARDDDYNAQGYKQNQYPSQQYGHQEPQSRSNIDNTSDYMKNRTKARQTGFNIITNEIR